ncbi:MAG: LysE family translocator [Cyanobacteria bacterium P01_G01_bin.38]
MSTQLILFFTTAIVMICTPGPDIIYVSTRGVAQGRRVALLSTLGVCLGYIVHTFLAVLGLSALLQASSLAFNIVRYAGAAYLVYLGIKTLASKRPLLETASTQKVATGRTHRIVLQGMLTSMLNPKGILFFMAFLPQFMSAGSLAIPLQMLLLGLTFTLLCLIIYGLIGTLTGTVGNRLVQRPNVAGFMKWFSGSVLVGLGLRMALPERR